MVDLKAALDKREITIGCAKCGHQMRQTIGRLRSKSDLTCPLCRSVMHVDLSKFGRQVSAVQRQLNDMFRKRR